MTEPSIPAHPSPKRSIWAVIASIMAVMLACAAAITIYLATAKRSLSVETQPPGATVFLNGRLAGKTPLRITDLDGGSYSLRIEKENYAPLDFPITLGMGTTRFSEKLPARGTGSVKIDIAPEGSEVLLDGELAGHTPLELTGVPVGTHDLTVRKTNFKPFNQRIDVLPNEVVPFKNIALEDIVLGMLQNAIDKDKQRVGNYQDMGHYLFVNNRIKESAEYYVSGLKVASEALAFPKEMTPDERALEQRLRNEDVQKIHEDIRKKQGHNGNNIAKKDMELFVKLVNQQQLEVAGKNVGEWTWVMAQAENFIKDNKFEEAATLYIKHVDAAKNMPSVAQAYIGLISVRLKMKRVAEAVQATNDLIVTPYGRDPAILRQAANTIYGQAGAFVNQERAQLLSQSEVLLRRALGGQKRGEMSALCKFELGYVLTLQERHEESIQLYTDSIVETNEQSTKELRCQRLVDAHRKLNQKEKARDILVLLAKSPREYIKTNAEEQLKQLGAK